MLEPGRGIAPEDWRALRRACRYLEHPSLAARLTSLVGVPIEQGMRMLPRDWNARLRETLHGTVERSLRIAISTLPVEGLPAGRGLHMTLGAATGAVAGAFGLPALLLELPVSTAIMLRGIAAVAKAQGEDPREVETRAECVKVFALGGPPAEDDAAETGYYGLRLSLALHLAPMVGSRTALPSSVAFVRAVVNRFGVAVSDKAAAQMVPVMGALAAGLLNVVFVRHFHDIAWGHFNIRRLERAYGADTIEAAYREVVAEEDLAPEPGAQPNEAGSRDLKRRSVT